MNRPRRVNPKPAAVKCELAMRGHAVSLQLTSGFAVRRPVSLETQGKFLYPWRNQNQLTCTKSDIEDKKVALDRGGGGRLALALRARATVEKQRGENHENW